MTVSPPISETQRSLYQHDYPAKNMTEPDHHVFSIDPHARRIDKPWGYEILLTPGDVPYTAKLIHVTAGKRLSLQLHDTKVETQTLVAGRCTLVLEGADGELHAIDMRPGVGYHVAVGQRHRLWADTNEDATVFEASTPEAGTTLRLEDDYARPHETEQIRKAERAAHFANDFRRRLQRDR
jgi:mannose-6-phosphate isomerase-like protein (cupin superfamily)